MPHSSPDSVYASFISTDDYLPGFFILWYSLKKQQLLARQARRQQGGADDKTDDDDYEFVALVLPRLSEKSVKFLKDVLKLKLVYLGGVNVGKQASNLDPRFSETWTKASVFSLMQYKRIVLLDADMAVLRPQVENLITMDLPERHIAAVHDCLCNPNKMAHYPKHHSAENCPFSVTEEKVAVTAGVDAPPVEKSDIKLEKHEFSKDTHHLLNGGLVILQPNEDDAKLIEAKLSDPETTARYQFADQDLWADVFRDRFIPLSYEYNALKTLSETHSLLWQLDNISVLHYILDKPWLKQKPKEDGTVPPQHHTHPLWWSLYHEAISALDKGELLKSVGIDDKEEKKATGPEIAPLVEFLKQLVTRESV